jgi:hypothetical protein
MKRIRFQTQINAAAHKVYEVMLGLKDKSNYEYWTATFNPTSTYEGNWEIGSKMHFIGVDENGKKGGMLSKIMDHQPGKFVSIMHVGMIDGEDEITTGEQVEQWTGGMENYTYQEENGVTTVTVELDAVEEFLDYFNGTYPEALGKIKEIAEKA